jgi:multiple sugar transport system permease protein
VNPRPWWRRGARAGLVLLVVLYCAFPIYFMIVQSLKTPREHVFGNPLIVTSPTLENFTTLFDLPGSGRRWGGITIRRNFATWLTNTLVVLAGSVAISLVLGVLAGYALGRLRPPGHRWWRRALFATYVVPHTILFVPLYQVILQLRLDDRLPTLLLVYPAMALPFCIWILSTYFEHLPREVEEAALVEGASRRTAFLRIILPMSRSVIVAAGIFTLGTVAADLTYASVFLLSRETQTVAVGLAARGSIVDQPLALAGINLMAAPVLLACALFARDYARGLTAAMLEGS